MAQEEQNINTHQGTTAEPEKTLGVLLDESKALIAALSFVAAFIIFLTNQSQNISEALSKISPGDSSFKYLQIQEEFVNFLAFFALALVFVLTWELLETMQGQHRTLRARLFEIFLTTISILVCLYWIFNLFLTWSVFLSWAVALFIGSFVTIRLVYVFQGFHLARRLGRVKRRLFSLRKN